MAALLLALQCPDPEAIQGFASALLPMSGEQRQKLVALIKKSAEEAKVACRNIRRDANKHFDQAEYWLRSWAAPMVRFFTLGHINPRKMVAEEVRKALLAASAMINSSLWWWIRQVGLRFAFGLSLWLTWALTHP